MSRLVVLTHPSQVPGFQLAGVETYPAEKSSDVEQKLRLFFGNQESILLAVDHDLLPGIDPVLMRTLQNSDTIQLVSIPGGLATGKAPSRNDSIADLIQHAIGFRITLKGKKDE
jgi:vacuolar-type H+-ATPase subunit F/Vma7